MKILIDDGMQIQIGTGIGNYSLYLYQELKRRDDVQVDLYQFDKTGMSKKEGRLKYLLHINSFKYRSMCGQYDVVHFTNYAMPVLKNKKVKYVVTIHDLAAFNYRESVSALYGIYNRFAIRHAMCHADVVLTVSDAIKKELREKWKIFCDKIKVAYPGLYDGYNDRGKVFDRKYDLESLNALEKNKFFLHVGTVEIRKNLGIVIEAFLELKKQGKADNYKLVLAGRKGFGYAEYEKLIYKSKYAKDIIITGYISTNDCKKLYKEAAAYIFPSIYEGFGSTQLECMINHLPIILSDIPTNKEVSGDYGLYFDLKDKASLEIQMEKLIKGEYDYDLRNKKADLICDKYKWEQLIENYLEAYRG